MAHTRENSEATCDENKHRTRGVEGGQEVNFHLGLDWSVAQQWQRILKESHLRSLGKERTLSKGRLRCGRLISLKSAVGTCVSVRG